MSRNRIIYQSEALFVGPTGAGALTQIQRVQSVGHNATLNRTNVNQFGQLAQLDRIQINPPTVGLNFECLLVNAVNANRLGFVTDNSVSCISNILSGVTDIKNYYIALSADGSNMLASTGAGCFGFGNGFISNAQFQGAVGGLPTETYTVEALNSATYIISSGLVPTVDQKTGLKEPNIEFVIPTAVTGTATSNAALQPGDITVTLADTLGFSTSDLHIQNFNLQVPLAREDINQLGTRFAFAKVITFPVTVTASFDCIAADLAASNLADKLCADAETNLTIVLKKPDCSGLGADAIRFGLSGCKLDSTNYTSNLTAAATCTFSYSTLIGAATDTNRGLFLSGISS